MTPPLVVVQDAPCEFPYTYTHELYKDGVLVAAYGDPAWPTWITWDDATQQFDYDITEVADIGLYNVNTVTEIPQVDPLTGVNRIIESTFDINVMSDCHITAFEDKVIPKMTHGVTLAPTIENAFFEDVTANQVYNAIPLYCGLRTCTLDPVHPFMSIVGDDVVV